MSFSLDTCATLSILLNVHTLFSSEALRSSPGPVLLLPAKAGLINLTIRLLKCVQTLDCTHFHSLSVWLVNPILTGNGNLTGAKYLELLQNYIIPAIRDLVVPFETLWFQHDGYPAHNSRMMKRKYGTWSEADMERALAYHAAYRNGDMNFNECCRQYGIPKPTLKSHLDCKNIKANDGTKSLGRITTLSPKIERELAEHILKLEELLFGLTIKDIWATAVGPFVPKVRMWMTYRSSYLCTNTPGKKVYIPVYAPGRGLINKLYMLVESMHTGDGEMQHSVSSTELKQLVPLNLTLYYKLRVTNV
ncbi:hypothetical protein NQ318_019756 [Aromia moschata]|uniref:HTH psq-type domain-containing protein n=1 Tax=Aromia moschata TaxID=1265417 RepID=A0AAV8XCR5_9CUCU|nr:hypothetical protein NQ318_019756 [Aromia moschata]